MDGIHTISASSLARTRSQGSMKETKTEISSLRMCVNCYFFFTARTMSYLPEEEEDKLNHQSPINKSLPKSPQSSFPKLLSPHSKRIIPLSLQNQKGFNNQSSQKRSLLPPFHTSHLLLDNYKSTIQAKSWAEPPSLASSQD